MVIGISPLVDFAFKLMLGSPEHSGITIHFLNSILVGQPKITQVKFQNPFLDKESDDDKLSVLDILATDEHGRLLNIEMQTSLPAGMAQRLTYYVSALYAGQLSEGQQYSKLRPAINICVMSQALFASPPALHLDFRLREMSTSRALTDDLQIHLLQLNHLQVTADTVYYATPAERWAYFLQNADKLTPVDIRRLFPDQEFSEAAGVLEMISKTPEQLMAYNARLKFQRDEAARIEQAALEGEARGEARGREIGVEIGEARGVEIGETRGRQIGRISLLQELLGQRIWTAEEFAASDASQLSAMADQLQQQLRARNS
jgi:predicted transposase/invertase (TIGR01784 family)